MVTHEYTDGEHDNAYDVTYTNWAPVDAGTGTWTREVTKTCNYCHHKEGPTEESAYDLSYDLNGSKDKQTADFATVEHVAKTKVRPISRRARAIPSQAGTRPWTAPARATRLAPILCSKPR